MVKFAVIQISDGNFIVSSEGYTDINKARMAFHGLCKNLYSEIESINEFTVLLMNNGGGIVEQEGYQKPVEEEQVENPVEE